MGMGCESHQNSFEKPAPTHCSKSGLKQRGWTDRAIERFLKHPDKEAPNPHYKSASPMKLYLLTRVDDIERSGEFQAFQNKNKTKIESSRKAVQTKRERLLAEVQGWNIKIEKREHQELVKNAIRSYNTFKENIAWERGRDDYDYEPASLNSDWGFLERITVNFLRHNLSDYDNRLETLFGKVGKAEAYNILNRKIYDKIAQVYPQLSDECERQMRRKTEGGFPFN
jgi:hypothetical protein